MYIYIISYVYIYILYIHIYVYRCDYWQRIEYCMRRMVHELKIQIQGSSLVTEHVTGMPNFRLSLPCFEGHGKSSRKPQRSGFLVKIE